MRIIMIVLFINIFNTAFSQMDTIQWAQKSSLPDAIQKIASGYFLIDSNFLLIQHRLKLFYS
jgi:hypothetical protein